MNQWAAEKALQRMHTDRIVRNESVMAWYARCVDHVRQVRPDVPRLHPEYSPADLLVALALWMELTERGQSDPAFPFDYESALTLPDPEGQQPASKPPQWLYPSLGVMGLGVALEFITGSRAYEPISVVGSAAVVLALYVARRRLVIAVQPLRPGGRLYPMVSRAMDWSRQRQADDAGNSATQRSWRRHALLTKRQPPRRPNPVTSEEPAASARVAFSGRLTTEARDDLRDLYTRWDEYFLDQTMPRTPQQRKIYTVTGLMTVIVVFTALTFAMPIRWVAIILGLGLVYALGSGFLPRLYWRSWWRGTLAAGGEKGYSGEIGPQWLRWCEDGNPFSWSDFIDAKVSERAILLYVMKADPLPLHRSWLRSEADWQRVLDWLERSGVAVRRYRNRGQPIVP